MQKLITIYVDAHAYMDGKWVKGTHADKHGFVERFLLAHLPDPRLRSRIVPRSGPVHGLLSFLAPDLCFRLQSRG